MVTNPTRDVMGDSMTEPPSAVVSDADLVMELIGGSHDALAVLYDRHSSAVFAAAMRASRDHWIASEVVQETFLAFWDRAERFDPSKGSLAGWLATIARNRAIDHLRAAGRHQRAATFSSFGAEADDHTTVEWLTASGELVGSASPEPAPELALTSKETRAAIEDAMASLDPIERSVIELAYAGGLTQVEIASRLGWPLGTVKTRTRRALHHLRERLEASPAGVMPVAVPVAVPCSGVVGTPCV
jgi:RNA polymerase sigma-70 factor (ECF subfamily)